MFGQPIRLNNPGMTFEDLEELSFYLKAFTTARNARVLQNGRLIDNTDKILATTANDFGDARGIIRMNLDNFDMWRVDWEVTCSSCHSSLYP